MSFSDQRIKCIKIAIFSTQHIHKGVHILVSNSVGEAKCLAIRNFLVYSVNALEIKCGGEEKSTCAWLLTVLQLWSSDVLLETLCKIPSPASMDQYYLKIAVNLCSLNILMSAVFYYYPEIVTTHLIWRGKKMASLKC